MRTTYLPFVLAVILAVVKANKLQVKNFAADPTLRAAVKKAEPLFNTHIAAGLEKIPVTPEAKASLLRRHDFLFQINSNITLDLKNVHVVEGPNFKVSSVSADLEYLNMAVEGSVGTIGVEGNFSITSLSNVKISPVVREGSFRLVFESVAFKGFTGLREDGDWLLTENYDIDYVPAAVTLTPQHLTAHGPVSSEISISTFEDAVSARIKSHLRSSMNRYLTKQFDAVASKCSLTKLLLDDDTTITNFRSHSRSLKGNLDDLFDDLVIDYIRYQTKDTKGTISIPAEINRSFSKTILWVEWHGSFVAKDAWAKNLSTIERTKGMSMIHNEGVFTVFGSLGLGDLQGGLDHWHAEFMGIGRSGYLRASVGHNAFFIRVNIDMKDMSQPKFSIKKLCIEEIDDIDFDVTGFGWFGNWLINTVLPWLLSFFTDTIKYYINQYLQKVVS